MIDIWKINMDLGEYMSVDEVVNAYKGLYHSVLDEEAKKLVKLGATTPDPRLAARNFELGNNLEEYRKNLHKHERSRFAAFIYGRNIVLLDSGDADGRWNQNEIQFWEKREKTIETFVTIGKHWYSQFQKTQPPVSLGRNSDDATNAHLYDKTVKLPPATLGDLNEVKKKAIGSQYSGSEINLRWIFHSTICQNQHVENYHHIVHLFVSVDELDYIQEFSTVQIPEPMLWHIFWGAAEAWLLMQTGHTIDEDQPEEPNPFFQVTQEDSGPWAPIVNTDIKHMNIVLGDAVQDYYPAYKMPKMIDFGLGHDDNRYPNKRSKLNRDGTWKTAHRGTPGWNPPEAYHRPWKEYENEAIDGRTDIWQVGLVMLNLMEDRPIRLEGNQKVGTDMEHSKEYKRTYSCALEQLVFDCFAMDPKKHPTIGNILYRTRVGRKCWENAYGNLNVPDADVPERFRLIWNEDPIREDTRWSPSKRRRSEEDEESQHDYTSYKSG
ncbi:S-TKc domain containing protein [Pyrenophora teres f. maculata]|nr:S-TKc domain containing protein [Pyrenophora teres f. maculata]